MRSGRMPDICAYIAEIIYDELNELALVLVLENVLDPEVPIELEVTPPVLLILLIHPSAPEVVQLAVALDALVLHETDALYPADMLYVLDWNEIML